MIRDHQHVKYDNFFVTFPLCPPQACSLLFMLRVNCVANSSFCIRNLFKSRKLKNWRYRRSLALYMNGRKEDESFFFFISRARFAIKKSSAEKMKVKINVKIWNFSFYHGAVDRSRDERNSMQIMLLFEYINAHRSSKREWNLIQRLNKNKLQILKYFITEPITSGCKLLRISSKR